MKRILVVILVAFILSLPFTLSDAEDSIGASLSFSKGSFRIIDSGEYKSIDFEESLGMDFTLPPSSPALPGSVVSFVVDTRTASITPKVSGKFYEISIDKPILPNETPSIFG